jgi:hypothetical protein
VREGKNGNLNLVAAKLGGQVFDVPKQTWDAWTYGERWQFNRQFLDLAMSSGEQIILVTPPEKVPLGSTLERELNYLSSHGWLPQQVDDHWEVVRRNI